MKTKLIAMVIWVASIFWAYWETIFFGGNDMPKTLPELVCDGFALIGTTLSICLFIRGDKTSTEININVHKKV